MNIANNLGSYPSIGKMDARTAAAAQRIRACCPSYRGNAYVLFLLPAAVLFSIFAWRVVLPDAAGPITTSRGSAATYDLMIPRSSRVNGNSADHRTLHLVGGGRTTKTTYYLLTAEGQRLRCESQDYQRYANGGTVVAKIVYYTPVTRRGDTWLATDRPD